MRSPGRNRFTKSTGISQKGKIFNRDKEEASKRLHAYSKEISKAQDEFKSFLNDLKECANKESQKNGTWLNKKKKTSKEE